MTVMSTGARDAERLFGLVLSPCRAESGVVLAQPSPFVTERMTWCVNVLCSTEYAGLGLVCVLRRYYMIVFSNRTQRPVIMIARERRVQHECG
jgi:hypothetical protein